MTTELDKILKAVDSIRKITDFKPEIAMVLGSGLGALADVLDSPVVIPFDKVLNMPVSTTSSHAGEMHFGYLSSVPVLLFKGRVHLYEGYTSDEVVRAVRISSMLGAKTLILTNSAGGINSSYEVGDGVLITDHISSFVPSPVKGKFRTEFGTKTEFPDMTAIYDKEIQAILRDSAKKHGVSFKEGVYIQVPGAQYETPAEIKFYRTIGADLVGMSTAIEAIAARHAGMKVCAVSTVTNLAAGMDKKELNHEEVKAVGSATALKLAQVFKEAMEEIRKV